MRIDRIILNNIGSYEERIEFNTETTNDKNIVIFGGKNGAGKTTLFTAITLCLYGCLSMGYVNNNTNYVKAINKLINNKEKLNKYPSAYVTLHISIPQGRENNKYVITRKWVMKNGLKETFEVIKNGNFLNDEEVADFEIYIRNIIPPELFNLYFFDGEKIAEYFLNEGEKRIKQTFLTLCGYDIFEIMKNNFERVQSTSKTEVVEANEYFKLKKDVNNLENEIELIKNHIIQCETTIMDSNSELEKIEEEYSRSKGISNEEIININTKLKEESNKRSSLNQELKKLANDTIPFIMIKKLLEKVNSQIKSENDNFEVKAFKNIVNNSSFKEYIEKNANIESELLLDAIDNYIQTNYNLNNETILGLSFDQVVKVKSQIDYFLKYEDNKISNIKGEIKKSNNRSRYHRNKLEDSNEELFNAYIEKKNNLLETINNSMDEKDKIGNILIEKEANLEELIRNLEKKKNILEVQIKNKSISDISIRALLMLDELQEQLYNKKIKIVESNFKKLINTLMYKTNFIDDIKIDNDFKIHIYRYKEMKPNEIVEIFKEKTLEEARKILGESAINMICKIAKSNNEEEIISYFKVENRKMLMPVELDKTALSNGEKQIFVMSLYYSIMQISKNEVPFIIDTPFARIDMEHRDNISRYFFRKLKGQVFVLSTDEEINDRHINILKDNISVTYLLENKDNTKTIVTKDRYFEVEDDI